MKKKTSIKNHEVVHVLKEEKGSYTLRPDGDAFTDTIVHGDAATTLAALPDSFVQCIVTSPPYYFQRDYGDHKQLGQEESPEGYIARLVQIFRQSRRVLRDDGTLWLNLGDKYHNGQLLGMPWRVALALVADGWVLRSDVIWHKPNAMPSSVKNRPTTDHEYIFMFSKSSDYLYDADAIREPHVTFSENSKMKGGKELLWKSEKDTGRKERMPVNQTFTVVGGTKHPTPLEETRGQFGRFRFRNIATHILLSFQRN